MAGTDAIPSNLAGKQRSTSLHQPRQPHGPRKKLNARQMNFLCFPKKRGKQNEAGSIEEKSLDATSNCRSDEFAIIVNILLRRPWNRAGQKTTWTRLSLTSQAQP